jgi:hypothetical protein
MAQDRKTYINGFLFKKYNSTFLVATYISYSSLYFFIIAYIYIYIIIIINSVTYYTDL